MIHKNQYILSNVDYVIMNVPQWGTNKPCTDMIFGDGQYWYCYNISYYVSYVPVFIRVKRIFEYSDKLIFVKAIFE